MGRFRASSGDTVLEAVNFGGRPVILIKDHGGAVNRRAEMWRLMRDWLERPLAVACPLIF